MPRQYGLVEKDICSVSFIWRLEVAFILSGWLIAALAGTAAGVLSGFGVGGGTLLLVYMTTFAGLPQSLAQGINLLYFIPTAGASLPSHIKHGYVDWKSACPAIFTGLLGTALAAWVATTLDVALLRRLFGVFLLCVGTIELTRKSNKSSAP